MDLTPSAQSKRTEDIQDIAGLVVSDFNLEGKRDSLISNNFDEFREKLQDLINYLLYHDFERLLNAMYRLDINEDKFRKALANQLSENMARDLAELVIDREMQKVLTRRKYRENNP